MPKLLLPNTAAPGPGLQAGALQGAGLHWTMSGEQEQEQEQEQFDTYLRSCPSPDRSRGQSSMVPIHIMVLVWVADCRTAWWTRGSSWWWW